MEPFPQLRAHRVFAALDAQQIRQLESYLTLLVKWNARMNLTAVRAPEEIVRRHFAESIFAAGQIPSHIKTLLDFGSGAGLPGIPIAIVRPDIAVTLAESQNRKAAFLREAARTLDLNAEVWAARVEEMAPGRTFDGVTLRAVDRMMEACRTAVSRLVTGGRIVVFATANTEPALDRLAEVEWETAVPIPGSGQAFLKTGVRS